MHINPLKSLLILVILGIIGGSSYLVVKSWDKTNQLIATTNQEADQIKPAKSILPPLSETDNWTLYNNQEGAFSLKYPSYLQIAANSKTCPSGTFDRSVYLGPNTNSIIKCPKNLISQIYVTSLI